MKKFITILLFLFSINLQSAEVDLQFTNFLNEYQQYSINYFFDQLIYVACCKYTTSDANKIIAEANKIYSSDKNQIIDLISFLESLETNEFYKIPAKQANTIIKLGLFKMEKKQNEELVPAECKPPLKVDISNIYESSLDQYTPHKAQITHLNEDYSDNEDELDDLQLYDSETDNDGYELVLPPTLSLQSVRSSNEQASRAQQAQLEKPQLIKKAIDSLDDAYDKMQDSELLSDIIDQISMNNINVNQEELKGLTLLLGDLKPNVAVGIGLHIDKAIGYLNQIIDKS
ncbi:MAG: hypothetical protein P4L22_01475 [Candidatus Babeliales bacterium]|nr:hypothetical protein [Candidatus Babeliales bacterium]